jgi:hypothetical protein
MEISSRFRCKPPSVREDEAIPLISDVLLANPWRNKNKTHSRRDTRIFVQILLQQCIFPFVIPSRTRSLTSETSKQPVLDPPSSSTVSWLRTQVSRASGEGGLCTNRRRYLRDRERHKRRSRSFFGAAWRSWMDFDEKRRSLWRFWCERAWAKVNGQMGDDTRSATVKTLAGVISRQMQTKGGKEAAREDHQLASHRYSLPFLVFPHHLFFSFSSGHGRRLLQPVEVGLNTPPTTQAQGPAPGPSDVEIGSRPVAPLVSMASRLEQTGLAGCRRWTVAVPTVTRGQGVVVGSLASLVVLPWALDEMEQWTWSVGKKHPGWASIENKAVLILLMGKTPC